MKQRDLIKKLEAKIIPPGGIIYEDGLFFLAGDPEIPLKGFLIVNVKNILILLQNCR